MLLSLSCSVCNHGGLSQFRFLLPVPEARPECGKSRRWLRLVMGMGDIFSAGQRNLVWDIQFSRFARKPWDSQVTCSQVIAYLWKQLRFNQVIWLSSIASARSGRRTDWIHHQHFKITNYLLLAIKSAALLFTVCFKYLSVKSPLLSPLNLRCSIIPLLSYISVCTGLPVWLVIHRFTFTFELN